MILDSVSYFGKEWANSNNLTSVENSFEEVSNSYRSLPGAPNMLSYCFQSFFEEVTFKDYVKNL